LPAKSTRRRLQLLPGDRGWCLVQGELAFLARERTSSKSKRILQ